MISAVQVWNPDDWEHFALSLLQSRHGALSVHKIPAVHKGDLGVDFYCTDEAVAYQCYAVREPIDISTRADRQKGKITTDLRKFVSKVDEISKLFLQKKVRHWILLAPLHDSKDVNLHCAKKTLDVRAKKSGHLDDGFEVAIHDKASFSGDAVAGGMTAMSTLQLSVPSPTSEEMSEWQVGSPDLLANATQKLLKRAGADAVQDAVAEAIRSFMQCNAILEALRSGAPDLYEKIKGAITTRSRRLTLTGPQGGPAPGEILNTEMDNLVTAIKAAAPNLSESNAQEIALGAVSEWIMRCPLSFPSHAA